MFKTRLISGIVLVILALATIICSGPVLLVTLIGVSCIGMKERQTDWKLPVIWQL